jgi:endo-1,4-beta-xylanase
MYAMGTCSPHKNCSEADAANYTELFQDFSLTTPENALKMPQLFVADGKWDFTAADKAVKLAAANNLTVRAHNLVWVSHNPSWLATAASNMSDERLGETMEAHIKAAAGHFKGQVYSWDVVNEGMGNVPHLHKCDNWICTLKTSATRRKSGISVDWTRAGDTSKNMTYIERAFRVAHETDPNAKLFYNEFDIHSENDKMMMVEDMIRDLKAKGTPIHGIGMQTHIESDNAMKAYNATGFANVLKRWAALDIEIHITEMNIETRDSLFDGKTDVEKEAALAELYGSILSLCLAEPKCKSFETWGIGDRHNSLNGHGGEMPVPGAFLYDSFYQPKPVRFKLAEILANTAEVVLV